MLHPHNPIPQRHRRITDHPYLQLFPAGRIPTPHPTVGEYVDAEHDVAPPGQRNRGDVGQSTGEQLVGPRSDNGAQDRHHQDRAGELETQRPGRRDEGHGGEDDVRPGDEEAGETHQRRGQETGPVEEIHGTTSRDGF